MSRIPFLILLLLALQNSNSSAIQTPTTETDLSGTYTGTFVCGAAGLNGDTTITINGNQFTTADGKTGRIVASTTGGYTAVALQVGEVTATTSPTTISLRARKSGNRLTLMPVAGSNVECSFVPTGTARSRRRGTRQPAVPPATGTEVSNPAMPTTTPVPATPEQTPRPSPTPQPEPMPTPTPNPTATPTPEPSPTASPTPTATPTPEPSPTASPSPTATPAPSPRPTASPSPSPSPTPTPTPRPGLV